MTFIAPHYRKARKTTWLNFLRKDRYLVKTPWWLKKLYPGCLWDMPGKERTFYLTFDDGPHPDITPFVLDVLKKYNARATFFCIGKNAEQYPEVYKRILAEGHATGNHTQHHINGWKNSDENYLHDIRLADHFIQSSLFRPPYGRMKRSQVKKILSDNRIIVMWNILAGDWDASVSPEKCFDRVIKKISDGDILVYHDSEKAWERMSFALPRLLETFTAVGYRFEKIHTYNT
jgi:peptidoglycan/xylan/chitin deacetylase (PgdA/CDA1 family)